MSEAIGSIITQSQPRIDQKSGLGSVQVSFGNSEYHFNQVLNLVAPNGTAVSQPSIDSLEMLDADSMERLATLIGERTERNSTFKVMASATRTGNDTPVSSSANMVRSAYKIYSGTTESTDKSIQSGIDLVTSASVDSQ
jgi:hypothetical protein